jgi:hypothetical protein
MVETRQKIAVLACQALQDLIGPRVAGAGVSEIYLDYGLHVHPKRMAPALQAELDGLPGAHTVLLGYGLCGTGLVGLRAGPHRLIIPRTDDCIAILLGSVQAYLSAQQECPGTYYLTRGWLESRNHPLGEYRELVERFGTEDADHVIDAMFRNYTTLCLVASSPDDFEACRPLVREVAEFCAERWNMSYEERLGSGELVEKLVASPGAPAETLGEDFIVIPPGGSVGSGMFTRS